METHPWRRYPLINGSIEKLIVGSFPPNKFTIYPDRLIPGEDINFFYGSSANSFWEIFLNHFELDLDIYGSEESLNEFKDYLRNQNWGVTDIALIIERRKDSALDNDLNVLSYNNDIIVEIFQNNPIRSVLFTSNWVKERFDKKIRRLLNINPDTRFYTLISPSPSGLMSLDWARVIFPQRAGISNSDYRSFYYEWVFNQL